MSVCSPYSTLNLTRPSFSSRRRSDLEQSSAARHILAVTSRLLHSLEDILLRTVLFIILLSCVRSDTVILVTLIVFTYLLTSAEYADPSDGPSN